MRRLSDIVRNQNPVTLPPSASVKHACERMRHHKVGAVLVTDEKGRLVGIFTGRDAVGRVIAEGKSAEATTLAEVMTGQPVCVAPERSPSTLCV
jgi:CBS domain-containing protein